MSDGDCKHFLLLDLKKWGCEGTARVRLGIIKSIISHLDIIGIFIFLSCQCQPAKKVAAADGPRTVRPEKVSWLEAQVDLSDGMIDDQTTSRNWLYGEEGF